MPRSFDGVDDRITLAAGSVAAPTTISIAAILRSNDEVANKTIFSRGTGTNPKVVLRLTNAEVLSLFISASNRQSTTTVTIAKGWMLVCVTKAAGTVTPRAHFYQYSTDAWVHEAMTGTLADLGATPTGVPQIGAENSATPSTFWNGDIAVVGIWNVALSDAQVEPLAYSLPGWWQASPVGLWLLDQAATTTNVEDMTGGGAHQSALTGTTVTTNGPAIFNRGEPVSRVERIYGAVAPTGVLGATIATVS